MASFVAKVYNYQTKENFKRCLDSTMQNPPGCRYKNDHNHARGDLYDQLWIRNKDLEGFYHPYERSFDPEPTLDWMKANNYVLPVTACIIYLLFIFKWCPDYLKDKKRFELKTYWAYWNLLLSLFSFWGVSRVVPHLIYRMQTLPFEATVCESAHVAYGGGVAGLATLAFVLSKIPELIDTVFLVMMKKPPIFLHWYHHVTVLLYCWNAYVTESATGIYFCAMNYSVHAIMYFYYFLMNINSIPKWFPAWIITIAQISQMFFGTFLVGITIYYHFYGGNYYVAYDKVGPKCNNSIGNLTAGFLMYLSYFYLFVEFAVKKFIFKVKDLDSGIVRKSSDQAIASSSGKDKKTK